MLPRDMGGEFDEEEEGSCVDWVAQQILLEAEEQTRIGGEEGKDEGI